MNDNTRAYYEGQLSHHFLTARADAFQTLFEKLMGKAHPADFIACRPWGKVGDRKNDGYLPSERTLFQVYAPNQMRAADAIAKIDEDFKGALSHWKEHFDNWVFVHNAHEGLSPQILDKLLELQSQHAPLKLASWGLEELRQRLQRIPLDGLQSLFGFPPTSHLAPSTLPFVPVRDARIYGTDTDPNAFSPSLREFEERLVHRPVLAEQVEAALIERRFACLLGTGASGKTTLALVLAFSKLFGPEQSYYFDLAEADESSEAAESYRVAMQAIASQHGRDALLILDNIHLAEPLAQRLHLAWREEGQPVRLLLQGRFTQQGADRRGRQAPLEEIRRTALVLEVTPNDLVGVLQRLLRRTKSNLPVPQIPPAVLGEWLKVYGGELIAFSSAARRKLAQIVGGQHQLTEADAADFIRDEYLENQDPKQRIDSVERENLLAIAACADLELSLPAEGLPHAPGSALAVSLRRGLVWQSSHGRYGQFVRYRLCHPGMGKLLWEAAKPNTTRLDLACALAERSPFFGFTLGIRLARMQSDQDATKRVLASAVGGSDAFERLIEHGMTMLHDQCRRLTYFGVLSPSELDQGLASCRTLRQTALATHLGHVATFLKYAKTTLPKTWQVLAGTLEDEGHRQTLAKAAFATPLDHLVGFLIYAKSALPKAWQALADILADERHRQTLTQAAFATPLNHLVGFLIYAKRMLPKVWQASADILADEKNREALAQNALSAPLAELANVLVYTKTLMPTVWQALADTLGDEKNRQVLAQTALSTPVGHLASFLEYARKPLPKVWLALGDTLVDPKNRAVLGQAALTTPLAHLANFLVYTETSMPKVWQVLAVILADPKNRQTLARTALSTPLADLANFLAYARTSISTVWQALADTLAEQENRQALAHAALSTPMGHVASFLQYARKPLPKVWQALANTLVDPKNREVLGQAALTTPLADLANFLVYTETSMPKVWEVLDVTLADQKNLQKLAQTALSTPVAGLANFLAYTKTSMPAVWQVLADTLAGQKNRQTLVQAVLVTPLDHLASFLKIPMPKVWQALADSLAEQKNLQILIQTALATPLGHLASFLESAKTPLPKVWQALADTLADEKNRQTLAQTTLATPLHSLASFLEYAKTLMPKVWQALADTLADQKNRQTLLQATLTTGFSNLAGFMSYLGGALPNVAEALNTEMAREFNASGIEHVRLQVLPGDPRGFPDAERVLLGCGCRDLARALAGRLIEAADRSVWHVRGVHFNEVTTVLRLANTGDEPAIRRFLDQVVTKDWLQTQYEKVPPQLIAIALHVLWAYTPHYVCDHFLAAFPIPRVEAFIRFLHQVGPARAIPNIELLGASSLFNVDICGTTRQWPTQAGLDEIARHFFCGLGEKRLDSHQILFLAGLREMVRRRAHRIRFAPEIGERALTLLKATDSPLPNHQRLDAWLSDWLDRCAKHGWQLLRDNIPVPESVVLEPPILPATTDVSPKRETASQGRDQLATTGPT